MEAKKPLFDMGRLVATPGALRALDDAKVDGFALLARHARGDWGDLDAQDKQANARALVDGGRIFSAYKCTPTLKIWIITTAKDDSGARESTCLLRPEEY